VNQSDTSSPWLLPEVKGIRSESRWISFCECRTGTTSRPAVPCANSLWDSGATKRGLSQNVGFDGHCTTPVITPVDDEELMADVSACHHMEMFLLAIIWRCFSLPSYEHWSSDCRDRVWRV
jgi:hypothetical protein